MEQDASVHKLVDHLFRHEAGKMVSVLTRVLGIQQIELAEDIVQDTLLKALDAWKYGAIPDNPAAWLYRAAKNKAIDVLRREKHFKEIRSELTYALRSKNVLNAAVNHLFVEAQIEDSQLRMIFACCHPAIPAESQIALTLKTLCGLSIAEIASGFLTTEETITKRLYRAKEKIRTEHIALEVPPPHQLASRLEAVLKTLYLLFNEGYCSSHPEQLIRKDLCWEAMRLCQLLTRHPLTALPKTKALLSLMCFHASRFDARLTDNSQVVLLKHQDRALWSQDLIAQGQSYLYQSADGDELSIYHLEAAIASYHATAARFEDTNWEVLLKLYTILVGLWPNPVIALNRAIVIGYAEGPRRGLEELKKITSLPNNHLYHTALGDFYADIAEKKLAQASYYQALRLSKSKTEIDLLQDKISRCA